MEGYIYFSKLCDLVKQSTCFKITENPSCIDLLLINKPLSF